MGLDPCGPPRITKGTIMLALPIGISTSVYSKIIVVIEDTTSSGWGIAEWISLFLSAGLLLVAFVKFGVLFIHRCRPLQFFVTRPIKADNDDRWGFVVFVQNRSDKPVCFEFKIITSSNTNDNNILYQRIEERDAEYIRYWINNDNDGLKKHSEYKMSYEPDGSSNFLQLKNEDDSKKITKGYARMIPLMAGLWAVIAVEWSDELNIQESVSIIYTYKNKLIKSKVYVPKSLEKSNKGDQS